MTDDTPTPRSDPFGDAMWQADGDSAPAADEQLAGADARLALAEAQLAEQKDKLLRLAAEYDNFRKRSVRERQEAESRGMSLLVRGILDALDDLGRFAHVDPANTDPGTLQQGVEMVEKKLLKSLAGHGLEIVNPIGQPFDPAVQEAVTTAPADSPQEDHLVAQVFQVGYLFNGQLLRPARVVVKQWKGSSPDAGQP
jgi:molecular chaperone GrpE